MKLRSFFTVAVASLVLAGHVQAQSAVPDAAPTAASMGAVARTPWSREEIAALGERVADYHIAQLAGGSAYPKVRTGNRYPIDLKGWEQGAFLIGLTEFADFTGEPRYRQAILERGIGNEWRLGDRVYHADDHMIGQTYFWARENGAGDGAIEHMRATFDQILAKPSTVSLEFERAQPLCVERWCWCDALFMAPAAWLEMSRVTGDPRYAAFAKAEFWAATDYLWDPSEDLYFRDSSFFDERDADGRKLFWSRGNGWVFAGLARIIPLLDDGDPDKARFIELYRKMAAKLRQIQKPDGYWSGSLLADPATTSPESSGTGFYVYGMAWGVRAGLLDQATYEPVVRKGWTALAASIHPDGRLGWVQPISDRPAVVSYEDTHDYGYGAFLLAATEVAALDLRPGREVARLTVTNPSNFDRPDADIRLEGVRLDAPADVNGVSVGINGVRYAAEYDDAEGAGVLRFVAPLGAGETLQARILAEAVPYTDLVQASLNVRDPRGGYSSRRTLDVPADHTIGDGLMAFEGAGWESGSAAYRVYLDARNATDVFGKRQPLPVLTWIGQGQDNYHALSNWGMDVLKVGQTLGLGGLGVMTNGRAIQAQAGAITATVENPGPVSAFVRVKSDNFSQQDVAVTATYSIRAESPVTIVDAARSGAKIVLATGLVLNPGVTVIEASPREGSWGYVGTWGDQSLNSDPLGLAVFYRQDDVDAPPSRERDQIALSFGDHERVRYAFVALWSLGASGVHDAEAFQRYLDNTAEALATPVVARQVS